MTKNARQTALDVLNDIFGNDAYANISLDRNLRDSELSTVDKAFVTALVYGVVSKKDLLEWHITPFLKKEPKPWAKMLLLLTVYQILFMDKVPTSAAVDEAVKIAKRRDGQATANFINAVLRNFMRSEHRNEEPKDWETKYSMPKLLLDKMVRQFGGKRTGEILESLEKPSHVSLRKIDPTVEIEGTRASLLTESALIADSGNFAMTEEFQSGRITIQDETSQLVAPQLDLEGTEEVLDACAAPGGKSTHMAQYLTSGHITALDLYDHKLDLINQNAQRQHVADKITTQKADATMIFEEFGSDKFDRILVDAPCSGIGLIRRKPDIRYRKESSDFVDLQKIQLEILNSASKSLKKSGIMVYSTCTIFDEENFDVVRQFLESHPNFEQVEISSDKADMIKEGCIFINPEMYHTDGFFIAKFKKIGE
ncbi:16S rRNA (cytosine(9 67)-C(5))-methyltransferase [Lactococcus lactis subsp. lactis]|uniref:16S rRNA (cytosine(967)-C(5))-methyltransferase n=2 Tax=Lactococcus lactis TaxID=1358 RepID=A0A2A5SGM2_LACLH|nr:16S rRNA (cytosine(967)-C(5))-methyltransferase RsmB [Lactococcus lactis]KAA8702992.1 16S rRNA (cytosine(967)-C(5))-methyltransferase RsmB [Lactococcus lactis subsp. hordniae]KSU10990.1 16S rRNA (cytosine(9 67)-C(5))-methyltransferase [Lactococcus lactis subsp. lactis]MCT3134580.1 16S rRNA (cytosine(967)-C(5))-methyltransferase RsmB [Lactococcus lactis]PCS12657.1 ribosomal RNA small subunit methyltransferase B [Lactococcus lactis subsp. hordniae]